MQPRSLPTPSAPDGNPGSASTYLHYIHGLDSELRELCLRWVQVCRFTRQLPAGWEFFAGRLASLGIDRLGLTNTRVLELLEAVAGSGVRIPETEWKLRVARPWFALIEPMGDAQLVLPMHWLEGLELHDTSESVWIGKRALERPLCPDPFAHLDEEGAGASRETRKIDWSAYQSHRYGWQRRDVAGSPDVTEAHS
ncbi:hypothetical protein PLANPX_4057 [Lacipirellula parvula]|uniref:Uncharacterized protein n=1 Tax=Lacipirellula parvula TaxID=2650471 RepID=A0A5K7XDH9_9BACT|nr:hypothetical protein PLANPX_4057 [Lacipirellula parvula]